MSRVSLLPLLGVLALASPAFAQTPPDVCARPDSVAVRGNDRVSSVRVRTDAGLSPRDTLNYRTIQRAIQNLFATGEFDDVRVECEPNADASRATMWVVVKERPVLSEVTVGGTKAVPNRLVRDRVDLLVGRPVDPAQVAHVAERIDSLYEANGYYLAQIHVDTSVVGGQTKLTFRVDEGRRLAISGIEVVGNGQMASSEIVGAMKTRPEGFWFFRKGEFDEDKYAADIGERIPKRYARDGFVDFQIVKDTLIVDRDNGKALVRITVDEGKRYRVGAFEVVGNHRFSQEDIQRFYPFVPGHDQPSLLSRAGRIVGRGGPRGNFFDEAQWDDATGRVRTAYSNEGYIYASVRPVVDRAVGADSVPVVNLRWEIDEQRPATVNRVEIVGNDYTIESCIRNQIFVLPGDVFNQNRLIQSYQNIANLGFFETPLPPPDTRPVGEQGDVDIVFNVKEKRTGNVSFGASVGQGTGVGGFLGLDQPNVFGMCKRVSLQWQFGRYINDFNISYTDPNVRRSQISGTASAYHSQSRYVIADLGRFRRTGGSLRFGFPVPWSPYTRYYLSYGGEAVKYTGGIANRDASLQSCDNCFRSTLGASLTHDTRSDMPFASSGGMQSVDGTFNGGPLGGSANFQRYTTELRTYTQLGQVGGAKPGSQPMKFVLGLTARSGALFGDAGPFFVSQKFALGGTQYGEMLRGYEEFSITPRGYVIGTNNYNARRESFGGAFFTTTAEVGLRFNAQVYINTFFDAGNLWDRPRQIDPTRLFRGAGIGAALISPLGPIGLDWAYGFDRLDQFGRHAPKWQLHFRLGNIF